MYNQGSDPVLTNCPFRGNYGSDYGGGMYNTSSSNLTLNNCTFSSNQAGSYGAGMSSNRCDLVLTNCTFANNSAPEGNALAFNGGHSIVELRNCILWDDITAMWINDSSTINVLYSDISGGWPGEGNIDFDPMFVDADGPDHVPGTEDDDLRLAPLSPCVDSGDPGYVSGPDETDFDGNPRVVGGRVDMGAYESQPLIYVDDDAPGDPAPGNPNISDPQEDGTDVHPFDTIQEAIDIAKDGHTILVRPGVYSKIDFIGKAITVAGNEGAAVIEAWSLGSQLIVEKEDAVTFHTGEGPGSVLKNFIIRNSGIAISLNYGSSPTIRNLTIVDNDFGIAAYENSNPDISNCIFFDNKDGDLFQCQARYSCLVDRAQGQGNINVDPLFADAAGGDYHLMSEGWRWSTNEESWVYDEVTSSCIDSGDPALPLGDEPMNVPRDPNNEYGINLRINMGAYGGTCQASMPPLNWSIPLYETDPPEPNPARWATNGTPKEVYGGGDTFDYWVQMTAAEATDASGQVGYFFECTTEAGFSSGWQISRNYMVPVGRAGQSHRFRVKVRDQFGNETEWSEELSTN
jgi:parallel beta-helix repeat protein